MATTARYRRSAPLLRGNQQLSGENQFPAHDTETRSTSKSSTSTALLTLLLLARFYFRKPLARVESGRVKFATTFTSMQKVISSLNQQLLWFDERGPTSESCPVPARSSADVARDVPAAAAAGRQRPAQARPDLPPTLATASSGLRHLPAPDLSPDPKRDILGNRKNQEISSRPAQSGPPPPAPPVQLLEYNHPLEEKLPGSRLLTTLIIAISFWSSSTSSNSPRILAHPPVGWASLDGGVMGLVRPPVQPDPGQPS